MSFYLVVAVLIDTFVIRSMLVPAIMFLIGSRNWWPSKMPDHLTETHGSKTLNS